MNNMIWIFVEFIFAGIATVLIYFFIRSFLQRKDIDFNLSNIIVILLVFILNFFTNMYFNDNIVIISSASFIVAVIIGTFLFKDKMTWIIMSATFAFLAGAIAELIAVISVKDSIEKTKLKATQKSP